MVLTIGAMASVLAAAAHAQFFDDRYPSDQRYRRAPQSRDSIFPFFERPSAPPPQSSPFIRPQQPAEAIKPPPPTQRKQDTVTSTVMVIGDSLGEWLAYGLEETYATDAPDVAIVRNIHPTSGLVRYDPRNDTQEWSQIVKDSLGSDKPNAIVVMLGLNDRLPLRDRVPPRGQTPAQPAAGPTPQGQAAPPPPAPAAPQENAAAAASAPGNAYDFHTDKWEELYSKRFDDMIAALKRKGVPVLWVGLPAIRGAKSTTDMSYLDDLYRARAEKAGITYVDIWDGFVDDRGNYTVQGPDFEGQTRRLRTFDGIHFTKFGAIKLAHYVERELGRVLSNRLTPVALPGPEDTSAKPNSSGPRPVAGPVLPLAAAANTDGNDLVGAGGRAAPLTPDPVAVKVLSRGDPIPAPSGRADDFSWPRSGAEANSAPDVAPDTVAPVLPAPAKGTAVRTDVKKVDDPKNKGKAPAAANTTAR